MEGDSRGNLVLIDEVVRRRDCPVVGEVGKSCAFAIGERGVFGEGASLEEGATGRGLDEA